MEYTGNYIEEIIDKDKVKAYFEFFRKYNPLFKNVSLKEDQIDQYENDTIEATVAFKEEKEVDISDTESKSEEESSDDDICIQTNEIENTDQVESVESNRFYRDETTVFCDKYETDKSKNSVANRLATIIVDFERTIKNIKNEDEKYNFEIEDEIETAEIDLIDNDSFLDELMREENIYQEQNKKNMDRLPDEIDLEFENKTIKKESLVENQYSELSKIIKNEEHYKSEKTFTKEYEKAARKTSKIEKVDVAPGEKGNFQNWGEDKYLEERCFPELFPFGKGGYLSSLSEDKNENVGFAMYVKH